MSVRSLFARADEVLAQRYPFVLPALGYDAKAIEPAIDAQTKKYSCRSRSSRPASVLSLG